MVWYHTYRWYGIIHIDPVSLCLLSKTGNFSRFTNHAKMAEKWPRLGGPWPSWELAWTMNWVDRLRTSADKRMWSGRRAVVMRTGRRAEFLGVKLGCPRSRCRAVVSDVLCVRLYVHFVCVCVYMFMCVCVRTCIYDKSGYYGPRGEMFWNEQKKQNVFTYSPKISMTGFFFWLKVLKDFRWFIRHHSSVVESAALKKVSNP